MMNKTESFKSLKKKKKRQTSLKILLLHFPKESLNSLRLFNHHTEQIQYIKKYVVKPSGLSGLSEHCYRYFSINSRPFTMLNLNSAINYQ